MSKLIYTADANVKGARGDGHGKTSDGLLEVDLRAPTKGGGTNPEQLFAVGYAACFAEAVRAAGRRLKTEVDEVEIDSSVSMLTTDDRGFTVSVALDVTLPEITDADTAVEIVAAAHGICPYSNATRGNIDVDLKANGTPVA